MSSSKSEQHLLEEKTSIVDLSPIILFVYNRPEHTRQTVQALQNNVLAKESELFIFSDGPKTPEAQKSVDVVRDYIRSINGFKKINIIERERNLGLANSIIAGVTEIVNKYGKVIVLEDDLITSPFFLRYMNEALHCYESIETVMQISGYMFPIKLKLKGDTFFLPSISSWGWATWQRAWKHFDSTMPGYEKLKKSKKLQKRFNLNNAYPYFKILEAQLNGKIDTWDIGWYLSVFLLNGVTLYPSTSFTLNIGFDGSGVHCPAADIFKSSTLIYEYTGLKLIEQINVDQSNLKIISHYLRTRNTSTVNYFLSPLIKLKTIIMNIFQDK